jgi:hypothetical protein
MKRGFSFWRSERMNVWVRIGIFLGALLIWTSPLFAQMQARWVLFVAFKDPVIPPLYRGQIGQNLTGIAYIDSINQANNFAHLVSASHPALPSTQKYYWVFFEDSVDMEAIAAAYRAEPTGKVIAASPDYEVESHFTPNDSLFKRAYETPPIAQRCRQWALDSAHCQFEKAWDITRGDSNMIIAIVDNGIRYSQPDLLPKLRFNTLEDINNPGTFEPWPIYCSPLMTGSVEWSRLWLNSQGGFSDAEAGI